MTGVNTTHMYSTPGTYTVVGYAAHPYDPNIIVSCNSTTSIGVESQPVCGNATVEVGEQCDDGNTANADGCSNICQLETLTC
jgi:cysteine-rich repeat protein